MTAAGQTRIRTFKPRRRQLSPARAELFERLAPMLCLDVEGPTFDPVVEFARRAPLVLEIGTGGGEALTELAVRRPEIDLIGADVHTPGIAATLARIESNDLANVRLVHGDALQFIERLEPASLDGIHVYFPDPWPKSRHRGRRLISREHVDRFCRLLVPGGVLHVATDIADYADQALAVCDAHHELDGGLVTRPSWRPVTRYEQKGVAAGREVTDLAYRRRSATAVPGDRHGGRTPPRGEYDRTGVRRADR